MSEVKLTQYSRGAGCGCKISPQVLDTILGSASACANDPRLLVGSEQRDDAAVLDLGDGTALITTTDFFMPIVDDARDFGRIASVNALSDVYAMGGRPLVAIAVLGWPVETLPAEIANQVVEGAREACGAAGIALAGGHSIDSSEPIFGLAVSGRVRVEHLKRNGGAQAGDRLFLTKPLGVGILSTAAKQGRLDPGHASLARDSMLELNLIGAELGEQAWVHAMTDVTGFGFLGHLTEMCEASELTARVTFERVPLLDAKVVERYREEGCVPGGTDRNWASYGNKVSPLPEPQRQLLCDPQTSGGLLVAVAPAREADFLRLAAAHGLELASIGELMPREQPLIRVV